MPPSVGSRSYRKWTGCAGKKRYYEATGKRDVAEAQSRVAHLGLYFAGWRIARIDTPAEPGTTKNKEGRTFYLTPELRACLEAQRATTEALQRQTGRIISSVFHREGTPMKSFWKAWKTACKAAGAPGRLPHDFVGRPSGTWSAPGYHAQSP